MEQGYCVKCKAKKTIKDAEEVTMKNGRSALRGKCPDCGTGMYRILGKKKQFPRHDKNSGQNAYIIKVDFSVRCFYLRGGGQI